MKSRRLLIGVVVLAVVAAFAGVAMMEKKVETSVRETLAALGASCGTVRYRLLADELTLEDVTHATTLMGMETRTEIRSIVVNGPDEKALDPATPGRPRVAARIAARGIVQKSVVPASEKASEIPEATCSIEELVIENWHQNLGRVFAEYQKAPLSEPFFAALLDYSAARLFYTGYKGESSLNGFAVNVGVGRLTVSDMQDACFSYLVEDISFSGVVQGGVSRAGVTRLRLPSPRLLAVATDVLARMENDPTGPNAAEAAALRSLGWEYLRSTPYEKLWFEDADFSTQLPGSGTPTRLFSLKRFENTLGFSVPVHVGVRFQDLVVPRGIAALIRNAGVPDLGVRDFALDDLRLAVAVDAGASSLTLDAALRDLGSLSGNLACRTSGWNPDGPGSFMENAQAWGAAWASHTVFEKGTASFTDNGLLRRVLEALAQGGGMSPAVILPMLKEKAIYAARALPVAGLENAVTVMLDKPGTLTVEMTPVAPLPLAGLAIRAMLDPASLGLRASARPGSASLL